MKATTFCVTLFLKDWALSIIGYISLKTQIKQLFAPYPIVSLWVLSNPSSKVASFFHNLVVQPASFLSFMNNLASQTSRTWEENTHHLAFKPKSYIVFLPSKSNLNLWDLVSACFIEAFNRMDEAHYDYGEQSECLKSADLLN